MHLMYKIFFDTVQIFLPAGGVLLTTIFFPKMHTISQQSKYRRLKMHGPGSESTVYTPYTDYAGAGPGAGY